MVQASRVWQKDKHETSHALMLNEAKEESLKIDISLNVQATFSTVKLVLNQHVNDIVKYV